VGTSLASLGSETISQKRVRDIAGEQRDKLASIGVHKSVLIREFFSEQKKN
jgi:hypothetical protein